MRGHHSPPLTAEEKGWVRWQGAPKDGGLEEGLGAKLKGLAEPLPFVHQSEGLGQALVIKMGYYCTESFRAPPGVGRASMGRERGTGDNVTTLCGGLHTHTHTHRLLRNSAQPAPRQIPLWTCTQTQLSGSSWMQGVGWGFQKHIVAAQAVHRLRCLPPRPWTRGFTHISHPSSSGPSVALPITQTRGLWLRDRACLGGKWPCQDENQGPSAGPQRAQPPFQILGDSAILGAPSGHGPWVLRMSKTRHLQILFFVLSPPTLAPFWTHSILPSCSPSLRTLGSLSRCFTTRQTPLPQSPPAPPYISTETSPFTCLSFPPKVTRWHCSVRTHLKLQLFVI